MLIQPHEVDELARPSDAEHDRMARSIQEAEMLDIRPKLGDAVYLDVVAAPDQHELLLSGGEYTACGERRLFTGLKTTLAYYAWARCVKTNTSHLTRFGFVQKEDEYSRTTDYKERQTIYNDAFATADSYAMECLAYMRSMPDKYPTHCERKPVRANRTRFKIIGN